MSSDSVSAPRAHDDLGAAYVRLALAIEQHQPGYLDAYFGPPAWKREAEAAGKLSIAELMARARELAVAAQAYAGPAIRKRFLTKQAAAMQMILRLLSGEQVSYLEEVQGLYDVTPRRVDDTVFDAALRELERLLPGEGSLRERLQARRKRFEAPRESALALFQIVTAETRRRTRQLFALPDGEEVELALVNDKPWSAYNWYLGERRSLIEINTDSPLRANGLLDLMTHEGYPGHHSEHAVKEQTLYEQNGWLEACALLINAPECVVSEGIATTAAEVIFDAEEAERWQRAEIYSRAGVSDDLPVAEALRLQEVMRALAGVSDNAALMLHVDGRTPEEVIAYLLRYSSRTREEAERSIRFMTNPLFRSYTFTYSMGRELLASLFERGDKVEVFSRLLSEPLTPSDLREWRDTE